ncbi:GNAT family N-acetyltransferase [Mammaliicoccus sciuri]|uniref:GNAT family N-acetyltransferase n=1 Tax=Mammaliicoccus sciuri TaxID=1296 RepID=UPI0034DD9FE4
MIKLQILKKKDIYKFYDLKKCLDNETNYMLYSKNERTFDKNLLVEEINKENCKGFILGAFDGNKMVGYIDLEGSTLKKISHIGCIVIGIDKNYRRRGLGEKLLKKTIELAKYYDFKKIELTVITNNTSALNLYLKLGFEKEGIRKSSININGSLFDEYYMAKFI